MSSAVAVREVVSRETGEVLPVAVTPFDMGTYLSDVKSTKHTAQQQALMAAYDAACESLIGPNDVQKEGNRTFKKKSAWRKLARHFGISVACSLDSVRVERSESGFTAYAVANAAAPWGQSWTDVGACSSDEATGRRTITTADAVATAMTRASNRAVSNLIAMGEVSAEEIGERGADRGAPREDKASRDKKMPFGKNKGTRLGDMTLEDLDSAKKWCVGKQKDDPKAFADLVAALNDVIAEKTPKGPSGSDASYEEFPGALQDEDDDLPF